MTKKAFIILGIIGILIILLATYILIFISKEKNIYQIIPKDAFAVISINDPMQLWTELEGSAVWQSFKDTEIANDVQLTLTAMKKKLGSERNRQLLQILFNKQVSLVVSKTNNKNHFFMLADIGLKSNLIQFLSEMKNVLFPESTDIKYDEEKVASKKVQIIKLMELRKQIVYTFIHNIMIIGDDLSLIEKCILTANNEIPNLNEYPGFVQVNEHLTEKDEIKIFVNSKLLFPTITEMFLSPLNPLIQQLFTVSNYLGIGLSWQDDGVLLRGFNSVELEAGESNINLLLSQTPQKGKLTLIAPRNSQAGTSLTFNNFQNIWEFSLNHLRRDAIAWANFNDSRREVEKDLGINVEKDLLSWIGKEIGAISLPAPVYGEQSKNVILIATRDKKEAFASLGRIKAAIEKNKPIIFKEKEYKGFFISYMDLPFYLKIFFNPIFKKMTKPYWTMIEDYVLFSDQIETLEEVIDAYLAKNNLSVYSDFNKLSQHFRDEMNVFVYLKLEPAISSLKLNLKRSAIYTINNWQAYLSKFNTLGMSMNNSEGGIEHKIYLQLKPQVLTPITLRWKIETRGKIVAPPNAANIDGIPGDELIFGDETGCMRIVTSEGQNISGWPRYFEEPIMNSPAIGDINGDDKPDIVVAVGNKLFALNQTGGNLNANWPKVLSGPTFAAPVLNDLDKDNKLDIIIATNDKTVYALNWEAKPLNGWQQYTKGPIHATPAVGDIDDDNRPEIVVAAMDGQVYIWKSNGQLYLNWPQATQSVITSAPLLADVNGDDNLEIIVGSWNGKLYIWQKDGNFLDNWPQEIGAIISASPIIADLNNDLQPEILVGAENHKLYVWNSQGELAPGWPQSTLDKIKSSPVVADINDDMQMEIIAASDDGKVYAWDFNGRLLPDWPLRGSTTPILGDFDLDGKIDLAVGSWDRNFYYWSLKEKYAPHKVQWKKFQGDMKNTGVYYLK